MVKDRREYYRKWRKANQDKIRGYREKNYKQRYCKGCNIEVGKMKRYCPECLSVRQEEQKKRHNLEQTEYRKERYDIRDKEAYNDYHRKYQRGKKFREYQKQWAKNYRKQKKSMNYVDMDKVIKLINNKIKLDFSS